MRFCFCLISPHLVQNKFNNELFRLLGDVRINLNDIVEVRALSHEETKGIIRTFGVGGLFGYFGKYYKSTLGKMLFYATKRANTVLIATKEGKNIVISPDDLSMVDVIKTQIKVSSITLHK